MAPLAIGEPVPVSDRRGPLLVGIVNITEDSFSDGGRYLDAEAAVRHALRLRAQGADIVELGPAGSNPDSARVPTQQECARLTPVLDRLAAEHIPSSVDSFLPETQRFAVTARCGLVVMHSETALTLLKIRPCHCSAVTLLPVPQAVFLNRNFRKQ
ncbi:dihydropteroate synthase [Streptomyces roseochromogenus]|nr:dihydropteroate synthase [Streptomyces roseochromogenus]